MFALNRLLLIVGITFLSFLYSQSARADICYDPQSVDEPVSDGDDSKEKTNNKGGKGKKNEGGDITPQHICDYPSPTPTTPSRPGTPSASVTNSTSGTYTVSWSASSSMITSGANQWGYELLEYRNGSYVKQYKTSPTTTSQAISSNSDGNYQYKVRGCNMNLNTGVPTCSSYSSLSATNYVRHKPSTPSAPSISSSTSTGSVTVNWSKPSGSVSFYRLQKRKNGGSWTWADSYHTGTSRAVTGLTDGSWDFRVRACNQYGWSCSSMSGGSSNVTVRNRPSTPTTPTVSSSTSTGSVTVNWAKPSGSVSFYRIQKRNNGGSWTWADGNHTPTSLTVSGLSDGSWDFRVRACNQYSWACSSYSSGSANTTVRLKPSAPATPTVSSSTSTGSVTVNWSKPSGSVSFYRLQKRKNGGSWTWADSSHTGTSRTVTGLTDGSWDFRVRACNQYSWACSSYSSGSANTTVRLRPSTPTTPTVSPSESTDGSITISWTKPSGTVGMYDVIQYKAGVSGYTLVADNTTGTSLSLPGRNDGDYRYRVRACNVSWSCSSYSSYSATSQVRNKPSTPTAPTISSSVKNTNGTITLSWTKPSGTVGMYDVIQYKAGVSGYTLVADNTTGTSLSLPGRSDGDYRYRVRACNVSWSCSSYSSYSATSQVRNKPSTPTAPTVPSTTSVSGTITVSWTKPSGTVGMYDVIQYKAGVSGYTLVADNTTGTSLSLSGRSDGDYRYRVRACNVSWSCSGYSSYGSYATVLHKPGTPGSISGPTSLNASGSFTLGWGNSSGQVDYYQTAHRRKPIDGTFESWVYVNRGEVNSYAYSGLADGEWDFAVRACNSSGCSGWRYIDPHVQVLHKPSTPPSISGPTLTDVDGSHTITWGASSGQVDAYELRQRYQLRGASSFTAWNTVYNSTGRTKFFTLLGDGEYDYAVRACNASGCSAFAYISPHVTVLKAPYSPSVSVDSSSDDGNYTLSWSNGGGVVDDYQYAESPGYDHWLSAGTATSRVISGKGDGSWRYKVKACNTSGCSSTALSNTVTVTHPTPAAPASLSVPTEVAETSYSISWAASISTATDDYQIAQKHVSGSWSGWTSRTGTSASVTVNESGSWTHKVRACNKLPDNTRKCSSAKVSSEVNVQLPPDWGEPGGSVADKTTGHIEGLTSDQTVGAVEGQGGVSGGAATYHTPIVLPPGRKGMQPSVSLNYSSRSGNGIAGVGWSLSAGSSIHRCSATYAQDGKTRAVTFSDTDKLCLDGQRLMLTSGAYGSSGATYRTELDIFARVTQLSGGINSGASFKVEYKNNRVSFYGDTTDSKHIPYGLSEPLSWAISKQKDRSGNNIIYSYDNRGSGEYTLKDIKYTGKGSTVGNRRVIFNYANRPDFSRSYLAGGLTLRTKRLSSISTFVGSSPVRTYNLGYQVSSHTQRSILRNIQECAASGQCLKPTVFDTYKPAMAWDNKDSSSSANRAVSEIGEIGGNDRVEHQDLDGDGLPEILHQSAEYNNKNNLVGYTTTVYTRNIYGDNVVAYDGGTNNTAIYLGARNMGDLNSDGITDFFTVNASNEVVIKQFKSNGDPINPQFSFVTMTTNVTMSSDYQRYRDWGASTLSIMDLNGDGYQDFAYVDGDYKIQGYFNQANGLLEFSSKKYMATLEVRSVYNTEKEDSPSYRDVDGDGIIDIIRVGQSGVTSSVMSMDFGRINSNGYWQVDETRTSSQLNLPINHFNNQYVFADLNGDGLSDFVRATKSNGFYWAVRLNKGNRTFANEVSLNTSLGIHENHFLNEDLRISTRVQALWGGLRTADLDNDGADELLVATGSDDDVCVNFSGNLNETGSFEPYTIEACNDELHEIETPVDSHPGHDINIDWARYDVRRFNWSILDFKATSSVITHDRTVYDVVKAPIATFMSLKGERTTGLQLKDIDNNGYTDFAYNVMTSFSFGAGDGYDWITVGGTRYYRAFISTSFRSGSPAYASGYFEQKNVMGLGTDEGRLTDSAYKVTDGLGKTFKWDYAPLSRRLTDRATGYPFYWVPKEASERYLDGEDENFYFTSSMYVVSGSQASNGVGGLNSKRYSYREAVYNRAGRGFQGFRTVAIDDVRSGTRSVTDFHQLYPRAGKIESVRTCLISDAGNDCTTSPISKTTVSNYHVNKTVANQNEQVKWVYPGKTTKQTYNLNNRFELLSEKITTIGNTTADVDAYGNVLKSVTTKDNGFDKTKTVITKSYAVNEADWRLNKMTSSRSDVSKLRASTVAGTAAGSDGTKWTKTTYSYNSQGNLHRIPTGTVTTASGSPQSHATSLSLNGDGLPTSVTTIGAPGASTSSDLIRKVSTTYSTDGYFPKTVTNDKGHQTTSIVSSKHGQPLSVTDANGVTVSYSYDVFGRLTSSTVPGGKLVEKGYQWCTYGCSNAPSEAVYMEFTQQEGSPTIKTYKDMFNRTLMTESQGFDGAVIFQQTVYNDKGQTTFESIPYFDIGGNPALGTRYTSFDALGRVLRKETDQANSSIMETTYQYGGYQTRIDVSDQGEYLTMYRTYGGDGQLIQTTDALGNVTRYAYDSMGNPITLQDANGNSIHAWYNGFGHKWKVNDPNMGVKTFAYNTYGEVESEKDANGDTLSMTYDGLGRMTYRAINGAEQASFDYVEVNEGNGVGQLASESGGGMTKTYQYDSLARPTTVTTTIDGMAYTTSTAYDGNYGRVKALTYPSGIKVAYGYDGYGYQTQVRNAKSGFVYQQVEQRDARLNVLEAHKNANKLLETRAYSEATGQMTNIHLETESAAELRHNLGYRYKAFGNLEEQSQWTPTGTYTESYWYDPLHRLTQSQRGTQTINYSYDAVGNLTSKSDYATSFNYVGSGGPNAVSSVTKLDGSTANFSYDANGNMTSGDGKTLTYNAFNKPLTVTAGGVVSTFSYGANLSRFKQTKGTETTIYLDKLVEITLDGGETRTKTYIDDIAIVERIDTVGQDIPDHQLRFTHRDRLGSVVTLTDHNNNITEQRSFDPFGKPRNGDLSDAGEATLIGTNDGFKPFSNRGFTDHEHLDDAELIHMNGRAYDYNLGRFLSVDPFIQSPGNSQSMNPYSYIMNNPLAGTDPSGYISKFPGERGCETGDFACQWDESIASVLDIPREQVTAYYNGVQAQQSKNGNGSNVKPEDIGSQGLQTAFNEDQLNNISDLFKDKDYAGAYGYILGEIQDLEGVDDDTKYWFEKAIEINLNKDTPANTWIRAFTRKGLAIDGIKATDEMLQGISNQIATNVISDVLRSGGVPKFNKLVVADIRVALSNGGQTIGGWGGSAYFWNLPYKDNKTVGQLIEGNASELRKFKQSYSHAFWTVAKEHHLGAVSEAYRNFKNSPGGGAIQADLACGFCLIID